jgi:hypothetical protein
MSRNHPKIDDLSEREKAILVVLSEADRPLFHWQVVDRLEPWYEKPSSFKASVSSHLASMKAKGLIKSRNMPTGERTVYVRGRRIEPTKRAWFTDNFKMARAKVPLKHDPIAYGELVGFNSGGIVNLRPYQQASVDSFKQQPDRAFRPHRPDAGKSVTVNISVDTKAFRRGLHMFTARPRTDDMIQMLDDIDKVEQTISSRLRRLNELVALNVTRSISRQFSDAISRGLY